MSLAFVSIVTHVDTQEAYSTPYTTLQQHGRRKEIQNGGAPKLLDRADSCMCDKHHEVVLIANSELE